MTPIPILTPVPAASLVPRACPSAQSRADPEGGELIEVVAAAGEIDP